jgi:REP element-mobilizing transposase RayT
MTTFGIHVIWTGYMTWPPGDQRGHWSPLFDFYGHLLANGGQLQLPDPITYQHAQGLAKEPPKILSDHEIAVVADKIGELVRWPNQFVGDKPCAFAAAIEPNHVHLLLGPVKEDIAKCVGRLKGTSSSAVIAASADNRERTWTAGYWTVFLFNMQAVEAVKKYIDEHNLRRGLPAEPYPWISPLI